MQLIEWLLIHVAEVVRWLWHVLAGGADWVWGILDGLLNPMLSPLLGFVNPICTAIGDAVYAVLAPLPPWLGLTVLSSLAGVVMLIAFRYTSNQDGIREAKARIKANLLALKLYKDNVRVTLACQWQLLGAITKLQRHMLFPVMIAMPPMLLTMAQMGVRYQWRPLRSGETTLVRMHVAEGAGVSDDPVLEPCVGLEVEVGPVPGGGVFVWRVRAGEPGRYTLRFHVNGRTLEKELVVGEGLQRVSAERPGRRWTTQLLHPAEPRLTGATSVTSIQIDYPASDSWYRGTNYWILSFFVVSMAAALLLKPVFRVTF